jgi:acyl-coenzyme A synthetase/AMP-(fatty) acid ligase
MHIDFLKKLFAENNDKEAIVWQDRIYSYRQILDQLNAWEATIRAENVRPGTVVVLEGDFSPNAIALFLALTERGCVLVPLAHSVATQKAEFINIAQGEVLFAIDADDRVAIQRLPGSATHPIYDRLKQLHHPGLVLFSSGSTGKSKAGVHDLTGLVEKFKLQRHCLRTITFLLYDHIGGVNTMLYTLSNAGCIVTVQDRSPDNVLRAIEKYKVELLPTSPTFLNLMLLSEAYKRYDLSMLKMVTYGTEPMPESTLKRLHCLLPTVRLLQTYGLSEVGILRSKSKSSDSLWVKVGGEGFATRVVDGVLHVQAQSSILGYLNAPSPFTEDGWLNTGDAVEVDGEYLRILGRKSEIINVGGEKVYPAEVESVIHEIDNVAEVTVYGKKNPIVGNIVCARIRLVQEENKKSFISALKKYCQQKLEDYKVPVKVTIVFERQYSERFKKIRRSEAGI